MKKSQVNKNFWEKLKRSARACLPDRQGGQAIYALAPMAGVTDSAFRQICKSFGADVVYSEMVSAAGLVYNSRKTLELMEFDKAERPFVVQLFGAKPEHFANAAKLISKKIKPDGIDINFGCPAKKVAKQGAGAALMNDIKLAREIIKAAIKNTSLPVSIKIRAKVGATSAMEFLRAVKDLPIAAVMIHGRSLKQGHSGAVDWKIIKQARPLVKGVLLANGGVKDKTSADEIIKKTRADGVGIGQAALGRPWVFKDVKFPQPPLLKGEEEIFKIILKHAKLVNKLKGQPGIIEMRKHLCWYVSGLPGAKKLREKLVKAESVEDIIAIFSF